MKKLHPLPIKKSIQSDFYVWDVETSVSYAEWCKQRKQQNPKFICPPEQTGIYFGLSPNPQSFVVGVIYGYNYSKTCYSVDEMILEFQHSRYKKKKVFAHNAYYDLSTLYGNIYKLDAAAILNGSRFISCTNGNCIFADSLNIYQTSVAKIGKLVGIQKTDLGDEFFTPSLNADVINRAYVDCQIVYEALFSIFEMAGDIKITQASLSMTYFRRFHQKHTIEHNENVKYFWDSYFGGRCEAFKLGVTDAVVYDINSSYPKAMRDCVFPNPKNLKLEYGISVKKFVRNILPNFEGCMYGRVKHVANWCGALPVKQKGKLYFPVGMLSGCWNFNELRYAIEKGFITIESISRVVYSERSASPFTEYITSLYNQRLETKDEFDKYRIKIFMNSLYGKFAQRILEENIYIEDIEKQFEIIKASQDDKTFIKISMFNSKRKDAILTVKSVKMADLAYSIPSYASYITSYSRIALLDGLLASGKGNVVYCDTDSKAVISDFGLTSSMKLGEWKKEGDINKVTGQWEPKKILEVNGLKNYVYFDPEKNKIMNRIKGVPTNAIQTGPNSYEYFNLLKTKESLRRGKPIEVVKRTKVISGDYDKRVVFEDGTTEPIKL